MEIRYEDKKLEKLCTDEREMRRKRSDIAGLWAGKLSANHRLLVRPDNLDDPLPSVIVTVIDIDDYH